MKKEQRSIKIDGEKLYVQFKERGLMSTKLCSDIGVNKGYFANAKHRGNMPMMMVILLESRYGIPRTTYVVEDEKEKSETTVVEVVPKEDFFSEENMKKLYKLMYSAMYSAMKQALNE